LSSFIEFVIFFSFYNWTIDMAYPKFHGITLANGSVVENLHIERLAADPTPITAGRLWINTTDKMIKYTGYDAGGAVVVQSFSSGAELAAALTDAKAYTDSQITALRGTAPELLDTLSEIAAAINNDPNVYNTLVTMVSTNIDAAKAAIRGEVSTAFDTLAEIETAIVRMDGDAATTGSFLKAVADEATARTNADSTLQTNINTVSTAVSTEATRATTAEGALDTRITTIEGETSGAIGTLASLTTDAKDNLVAAINEVDAHVDAEAVRAVAAEGVLTTAVATEATDRATAVSAVATDLATEVTTRSTQVGTLASLTTTAKDSLVAAINELDADTVVINSAITTEAAARAAADGELASLTTDAKGNLVAALNEVDAHVDAEAVRAVAAEGVLTTAVATEATDRATAVSAEATARAAADGNLASLSTTSKTDLVSAINEVNSAQAGAVTSLQSAINATKYTYTASTAALTHTITHNLDTTPLMVSVYVEGDDGKYRNDIVAVEETNNNVITIGLTESRKVKVAIMSMVAI
jgi:hypothetical protein